MGGGAGGLEGREGLEAGGAGGGWRAGGPELEGLEAGGGCRGMEGLEGESDASSIVKSSSFVRQTGLHREQNRKEFR